MYSIFVVVKCNKTFAAKNCSQYKPLKTLNIANINRCIGELEILTKYETNDIRYLTFLYFSITSSGINALAHVLQTT